MANSFYEYVAEVFEKKINKRNVVIYYDEKRELEPFFLELINNESLTDSIVTTKLLSTDIHFARMTGSMYELKLRIEPYFSSPQSDHIFLYIPGKKHEPNSSVLMELEMAGHCYTENALPLKKLARNCLRGFTSDGEIDKMLLDGEISYEVVVDLVEQIKDKQRASAVYTVLDSTENHIAIANWLSKKKYDSELSKMGAENELFSLIGSRLGIEIGDDTALDSARSKVARGCMLAELEHDYQGELPDTIASVPKPERSNEVKLALQINNYIRAFHQNSYEEMAIGIEQQLGLPDLGLDVSLLGSIDTFRFEERSLLQWCHQLLAERQSDKGLAVTHGRVDSFWARRSPERIALWDTCALIAQLLQQCEIVLAGSRSIANEPDAFITEYSKAEGWYKLDQLQRRLEEKVTSIDELDLLEKAISAGRQAYDSTTAKVSEDFTSSLIDSKWEIISDRQTGVFDSNVKASNELTAYFLVDALRYEMADELYERLQGMNEISLSPAVGSMPSITKVGMASVMPNAAGTFDVRVESGKMIPFVSNVALPDANSRKAYILERAKDVVDIPLHDILSFSNKKLFKRTEGSSLIVVRSTEIDSIGEGLASHLAHKIMGSIIGDIEKAVRKLAKNGVVRFIITADHGYLFAARRGEDYAISRPTGKEIEAHRRCWIGIGGDTPEGAIRVSSADLGYSGEFDLVVPKGIGLLAAHDGLSYHHGGCSLQELVVPVLTFRSAEALEEAKRTSIKAIVAGLPSSITNRLIVIRITVAEDLFLEEANLRVHMIANDGSIVGGAQMAAGAMYDPGSDRLIVKPGHEANVGLMLKDEECKKLKIVVSDAETNMELYSSDMLSVSLGV